MSLPKPESNDEANANDDEYWDIRRSPLSHGRQCIVASNCAQRKHTPFIALSPSAKLNVNNNNPTEIIHAPMKSTERLSPCDRTGSVLTTK